MLSLFRLLIAGFLVITFLCITAMPGNAQFGGGGQVAPAPVPQLVKPETATAKAAMELLDKECEIDAFDIPLSELADHLSGFGSPFFMDERAIKMAMLDGKTQIKSGSLKLPMRSAMRRILGPHGLRVEVVDEGLIITADFAELARKGIATSFWISRTRQELEGFEERLEKKVSIKLDEVPLRGAVAELRRLTELPILVDARALEEIGLTDDAPVSVEVKDVSAGAVLRIILRDLDLTYHWQDEILRITTLETCEGNLVNRVYFLEATGVAGNDMTGITQMIQTIIAPDTWEALGGPSTISPLPAGKRPAIIVSTITEVHEEIDDLLTVMRANHVGPDPTYDPKTISNRQSGIGLMNPNKQRQGGGGGFM